MDPRQITKEDKAAFSEYIRADKLKNGKLKNTKDKPNKDELSISPIGI